MILNDALCGETKIYGIIIIIFFLNSLDAARYVDIVREWLLKWSLDVDLSFSRAIFLCFSSDNKRKMIFRFESWIFQWFLGKVVFIDFYFIVEDVRFIENEL